MEQNHADQVTHIEGDKSASAAEGVWSIRNESFYCSGVILELHFPLNIFNYVI